VNRALAPGWNIWTEQTDSLAQRDTGWVQLYCEDGQEALDSTLFAFRLAELVNLPVMVVLDAFFLSHTYEPVDIPSEQQADNFLPPFQPKFQLDPAHPCAFNQLAPPNVYMEMRYSIQMAMAEVLRQYDSLEEEFARHCGRRYGLLEAVNCSDARIILLTSGTITSTARLVVEELRARGESVGLLKVKLFRPFPVEELRQVLVRTGKVAVIDRNFSFGASGIFAQELRAALCNMPRRPLVYGYVAGLGGRDVTTAVIEDIYWRTKQSTETQPEDVWIGLQEVSS